MISGGKKWHCASNTIVITGCRLAMTVSFSSWGKGRIQPDSLSANLKNSLPKLRFQTSPSFICPFPNVRNGQAQWKSSRWQLLWLWGGSNKAQSTQGWVQDSSERSQSGPSTSEGSGNFQLLFSNPIKTSGVETWGIKLCKWSMLNQEWSTINIQIVVQGSIFEDFLKKEGNLCTLCMILSHFDHDVNKKPLWSNKIQKISKSTFKSFLKPCKCINTKTWLKTKNISSKEC